MRISDWSSDVCSSDLVDEHDRGALGVALEPRHTVVNRGQKIAAVEQRRQRVALGPALQFGDRDIQYAVLAAQGVAFPAYPAQLVLNGVNGYNGELDRKYVVEGKGVSVVFDLGG